MLAASPAPFVDVLFISIDLRTLHDLVADSHLSASAAKALSRDANQNAAHSREASRLHSVRLQSGLMERRWSSRCPPKLFECRAQRDHLSSDAIDAPQHLTPGTHPPRRASMPLHCVADFCLIPMFVPHRLVMLPLTGLPNSQGHRRGWWCVPHPPVHPPSAGS